MKIFKYVIFFLVILILAFALFLGYFTAKDYKPKEKIILTDNEFADKINKDTAEILIWNIGYAGLGDDMSFFYDGGEKVRTTEKRTKENLHRIIKEIKSFDNLEFILLQEVDRNSKRSYFINESDSLKKYLPDYSSAFAPNYRVGFVPLPLNQPLGRVEGGLVTLTKKAPERFVRYSFPGNFAWPKNLFMLDRCFLTSEYQMTGRKKLYLINTHNSAYDDGDLKEQQMEYLKKFITKLYDNGHYVMVGGDWNQLPPGYQNKSKAVKKRIPDNYLPQQWKWVYDQEVPTNRTLNKPYDGTNRKSIIDYYLLSPNLKMIECKTIDLNFQYSDHQPVYLKFSFDNENT